MIHTKSVAELGKLIVDIADKVSQGCVDEALQQIRVSLAADAVLLSVECRKRSSPALRRLAAVVGSPLTVAGLISASGAAIDPRGHHTAMLDYLNPDTPTRYLLRLFRDQAQADFSTEDRALAEILLSQLVRGLETNSRRINADVEKTLYSDLLDRLQVGIILLDRSGRLLSVSARAAEILEKRDGLQIVQGRVCALNSAEDKKFQALIRATLAECPRPDEAEGQGLGLSKRSTGRKMGVIVRRVAGTDAEGRAAVSIYVRDAEITRDVQSELMRQIFDLTPAEAAVARRLTDGLSLEDTAVALDISRNTARAHLRSIFSKSGIKRQTELVRLVLNSAVVL